jgi:hypothetical protein
VFEVKRLFTVNSGACAHHQFQSPNSAAIVGYHPLLAPADAAELRALLGARIASEVQWAHSEQEHMVSSHFASVFFFCNAFTLAGAPKHDLANSHTVSEEKPELAGHGLGACFPPDFDTGVGKVALRSSAACVCGVSPVA